MVQKHYTKLILFCTLFLALLLYLNRAYAHIYNFITVHTTLKPTSQTSFVVSPTATSTKALSYVALGDSLTAGVGASRAENTLPYLIAKKLAGSDTTVTMMNLGQPGVRSNQVLIGQLPLALAANPEYVTLLIGVNDMHGFVSRAAFASNIRKIVTELRTKTHAKVTVITLPFIGSSKLLLPPYQWFFDVRTRQYNASLRNALKGVQVQLFDLYPVTKQYFMKSSELYAADEFHPSDAGYAVWVTKMYAN